MAINAKGQLPLHQGSIVITHKPDYGSCDANNNNPTGAVLQILDASNTSNIPSQLNGNRYTWTKNSPPQNLSSVKSSWYKDPSWTVVNLGRVFGLTLDNDGNIYVSNTSIYTGETILKHDCVYKIEGQNSSNYGTITKIYDFSPSTDHSNLGLGNIKIFYIGSVKFMAVTCWEDGKIHILKEPSGGGFWTHIDEYDPNFNDSTTSYPYGIALRKSRTNSSAYEVFFGEYNSANTGPNCNLFKVEINSSGSQVGHFISGSESQINNITIPIRPVNFSQNNGNNGNGWGTVCNANSAIPISDISFSSDGNKMVIAQQQLATSQDYQAHNAGVFEFIENSGVWGQVGIFPCGTYIDWSNGSMSGAFNGVGGCTYWNNILFSNNQTKCDTTILYSSDAIYGTWGNAKVNTTECNTGNIWNYGNNIYNNSVFVYGFQGLPSRNNFTTNASAFNYSLKVDADDIFSSCDKNELGDIEAFNKCNPICNDGGFEINDFSNWGWTMVDNRHEGSGIVLNNIVSSATGRVKTTPITTDGISVSPCGNTRHANSKWEIISAGFDPIITSLPTVHSGNYALKLGDKNDYSDCADWPWKSAESVQKSMKVTSSNKILKFWYAVVTNDASSLQSHANGAAAGFGVRVNSTFLPINPVPSGSSNSPIYAYNNSALTSVVCSTCNNNTISYLPWGCSSVDLSQYVDSTVTVEFIVFDCIHTGHFAYAYIDDICLGCDSDSIPLCNCTAEDYFTIKPMVSQSSGHQIWKDSTTCGGTITNALQCNKDYRFGIGWQMGNNCTGVDSAVLKYGTTALSINVIHANGATYFNYNFSQNGSYSVTYYLKKNGIICQQCTMNFNVQCADVPCTSCQKTLTKANLTTTQTNDTKSIGNISFTTGVTVQQVTMSIANIKYKWNKEGCQGDCKIPTSQRACILPDSNSQKVGTLQWSDYTSTNVNNAATNKCLEELKWNNDNSAALIAGSYNIPFSINLPKPLIEGCCKLEVEKLCIRLRFKDINCNVCDTVICLTDGQISKDCCYGGNWLNKSLDCTTSVPQTNTQLKISNSTNANSASKTQGSIKVECGTTITTSVGTTYTLTADYNCNTGIQGCSKTVTRKVKTPSGIFYGTWSYAKPFTFNEVGIHTVTYYAYCDAAQQRPCDSCVFYVNVEKNCCATPGTWKSADYTVTNLNAAGNWAPQTAPNHLIIGANTTPITAAVAVNFANLHYQCADATCTTAYMLRRINETTNQPYSPYLTDEPISNVGSPSVYAETFPVKAILQPTCGGKPCGTPIIIRINPIMKVNTGQGKK